MVGLPFEIINMVLLLRFLGCGVLNEVFYARFFKREEQKNFIQSQAELWCVECDPARVQRLL